MCVISVDMELALADVVMEAFLGFKVSILISNVIGRNYVYFLFYVP
jgi:hypothetical protein